MGEPVDDEFEELDDEDETESEEFADEQADAAALAEPPTANAPEVPQAPEAAAASPATVSPATMRVAEVGDVDPQQVLDAVRDRPVAEHAEVYEELHTHLQRTLAEIDGG